MSRSIREFREMLEPEDIVEIIRKFGVEPVRDTTLFILYPTIDHNLDGGSHKLYYYKKDKMFKSYTGEQKLFDIFQLVMDMHALRGKQISLRDAVKFCGIENDEPIEENQYYNTREQLEYLDELENLPTQQEIIMKEYPISILNKYVYNTSFLAPWMEEGITPNSMIKFNIKFDQSSNAIVMPYYSLQGELVGVRGRFLSEDAYAKYMPMKHGKETLAHPTSKVLFGLYQNKETIKKRHQVIIFEGEKSVLKMDSIYGQQNNFSVAVSGRTFSYDHLNLLLSLDVTDIIIAFDRDYKSILELEKDIADIKKMFSIALNMFNISVIVDKDFVLHHKNSPIDQGKEIFEELLEKRVFL